MFWPPPEPSALTSQSSLGSWLLPWLSNGPERLKVKSPPFEPDDFTPSEASRSALLIDCWLLKVLSRTCFGSTLLLLLPPQATRPVATASTTKEVRRMRNRLKTRDSFREGDGYGRTHARCG